MAGQSETAADGGFFGKLGDTLLGGINTGLDHRFNPKDPAKQVTQTPQGLVLQGTQQSNAGQHIPSWAWLLGIGGLVVVVFLVAKR